MITTRSRAAAATGRKTRASTSKRGGRVRALAEKRRARGLLRRARAAETKLAKFQRAASRQNNGLLEENQSLWGRLKLLLGGLDALLLRSGGLDALLLRSGGRQAEGDALTPRALRRAVRKLRARARLPTTGCAFEG